MSSNFIDLTGGRFGRLIVLRRDPSLRSGKVYWLCLCQCGKEIFVRGSNLKCGTKSCGCLAKERVSEANARHLLCGTTENNIWKAMRKRCNSPSDPAYKYYGARGIKCCERWNLFNNFLDDMGPRPPGLTLERINNDGDYEPSNCKWATMTEQNRNKRARGTAATR